VTDLYLQIIIQTEYFSIWGYSVIFLIGCEPGSLYDTLTFMCNLAYTPGIVISKQALAWFLITKSFSIFSKRYTQCVDQPVPMVDHSHCILDLTVHYIKGCCSINKHFSSDSFRDWEGFCISTRMLSSHYSIRLANSNECKQLFLLSCWRNN